MATNYSAGITSTSTTAANIQAFATFISTLLTNGGWVQTGDSGQTASASWPAATGTATPGGYQIWRMADTLQATYPVFIKLEYGSGASAAYFGLWLTIGTGSDGSGNITNVRFVRYYMTNNVGSGSYPCWGSATTSRVCFEAFYALGTAFIILSIERTIDSSGTPTGDGLLVFGWPAGYNVMHQYVDWAGVASGRQVSTPNPPYSPNVIVPPSYATGNDGSGNIAVMPFMYTGMKGICAFGVNYMMYYNTDLAANNTYTVNVGGSNMTYFAHGTPTGAAQMGGWTSAAFMMCYN